MHRTHTHPGVSRQLIEGGPHRHVIFNALLDETAFCVWGEDAPCGVRPVLAQHAKVAWCDSSGIEHVEEIVAPPLAMGSKPAATMHAAFVRVHPVCAIFWTVHGGVASSSVLTQLLQIGVWWPISVSPPWARDSWASGCRAANTKQASF